MIYILLGNDTKKKNAQVESFAKGYIVTPVSNTVVSKELLMTYASTISLFGEAPCIILDKVLSEGEITLSKSDLTTLKDSATLFIFREDTMLARDEKKYKAYATILSFARKELPQTEKSNPFVIADAFARKDKIGTWILYREAIEKGAEPEAVSGMLFWKIKTLLLNGSQVFSTEDLKHASWNIVSLYHRAHRGECDFVIGLEQLLLSSLSK
jgi:DNA polymerase III delta subunit